MKITRSIVGVVLGAVLSAALLVPRANAQYAQTPQAPTAQQPQKAQPIYDTGYYTNRAGRAVHRPEMTQGSAVPSGATAQCRDSSYSFSQSRRGTCSHHGGVARWLR